MSVDDTEARNLPWFEAACCHATLADLADREGSDVPAADGAAEADRAMALLSKIVGMGLHNLIVYDTEPVLDLLRNRPDLKLLMSDVVFPSDPFATPPPIP